MAHDICYYDSTSSDVIESAHQDYRLPDDYRWTHDNAAYRAMSAVLYAVAFVVGCAYVRMGLHVRFEGRQKLKAEPHRGCVLYCNHTQPVGDAFMSACALFPSRPSVIVSPANLGIPAIGRLLPALGALPVPTERRKMKEFVAAVRMCLAGGHCVVVFPEAHVWPYCTSIRPFQQSAFAFPVDDDVPAFCMTTTYQPRRFGARPRATAFIDGPFTTDAVLPRKERIDRLHEQVRSCMEARGHENTCDYVVYEKREKAVI